MAKRIEARGHKDGTRIWESDIADVLYVQSANRRRKLRLELLGDGVTIDYIDGAGSRLMYIPGAFVHDLTRWLQRYGGIE